MKNRALTDAVVRAAPSNPDKVIRLVDGRGLILQIAKSGRKTWMLRITTDGRDTAVTLGEFPEMNTVAARRAAEGHRAGRKSPSGKESEAPTQSFRAAYEQWLASKAISAKYRADIDGRITKNCQDLMPRPVAQITPQDIIAVCKAISNRGSLDQARRVRQLLGEVFDFSLIHGWCQMNPAPKAINKVLPARRRDHHSMVPVEEAPAVFRAIGHYPSIVVGHALQLLILTAMRTKEVRHLTWQMIDVDSRQIVLPASVMKMGREHRIPLSDQAVDLLKNMPRLSDDLVFPSPRATNRMLSDMALLAAMKSIHGATTHGWRATFSTWANDGVVTGRDIIEAALAHVGNGVIAAYDRGVRFEERRGLMQKWADYVAPVGG
jgi:integrase